MSSREQNAEYKEKIYIKTAKREIILIVLLDEKKNEVC